MGPATSTRRSFAAHRDFDLTGVWTLTPGRRRRARGRQRRRSPSTAFRRSSMPSTSSPSPCHPPCSPNSPWRRREPAGTSSSRSRSRPRSTRPARLADAVAAAELPTSCSSPFASRRKRDAGSPTISAGGPWRGGTARWLVRRAARRRVRRIARGVKRTGRSSTSARTCSISSTRRSARSSRSARVFTEPDIWHVIAAHEGGAVSTATLSMRLAIDPSVLEFDVYGSAGRQTLTARQTPPRAVLRHPARRAGGR